MLLAPVPPRLGSDSRGDEVFVLLLLMTGGFEVGVLGTTVGLEDVEEEDDVERSCGDASCCINRFCSKYEDESELLRELLSELLLMPAMLARLLDESSEYGLIEELATFVWLMGCIL